MDAANWFVAWEYELLYEVNGDREYYTRSRDRNQVEQEIQLVL